MNVFLQERLQERLNESVETFIDTYNKMQKGEIPFNAKTIDELEHDYAFKYLESIGYKYEYDEETGDFIYKKIRGKF